MGEFEYNIYDGSPEDIVDEGIDSSDGGLCTTTIDNALEMAAEQTQALITKKK